MTRGDYQLKMKWHLPLTAGIYSVCLVSTLFEIPKGDFTPLWQGLQYIDLFLSLCAHTSAVSVS